MKRCCNLRDRIDRSHVAPRLMQRAVFVMLTVSLVFFSSSIVSRAQSDSNSLPEHVAETREAILEAAEEATLEAMGVAIELNELPPEFGGAGGDGADPVKTFASLAPQKLGVAGEQRDLAQLFDTITDVLGAPYGREGTLFVWPSLALRSPGPLSETEREQAAVILDEATLAAFEDGGPYRGLRIDIGADGTWHFIGYQGTVASD